MKTKIGKVSRLVAIEAARAVGTNKATLTALSDLNAANIAKYLQEALDEADSECRTLGRSIEIRSSDTALPGSIERLRARREKYVKMRTVAYDLLGKSESAIMAMLRGKPVTRTTIRALCTGEQS